LSTSISTEQSSPYAKFLHSLWVIAQFELVRLFATRRGLLTLFTFSVVWYFLLTKGVMAAANFIQQNTSAMPNALLNSAGLGTFLTWPVAEFSAYWTFSLYLFPIFSLLFSADQTASDRDRGSLRFLMLRSSRDCVFFGRFAGQMIIQSALVMVTLLSTLIVALTHNMESIAASLQCVLMIAANLILVLLPFTALMALLSAAVRSPLQAMILALLVLLILSSVFSSINYRWPMLEFLTYLIPGIHLNELRELPPTETLSLAYIPIFQTLFLLFVGRFVMAKGAL